MRNVLKGKGLVVTTCLSFLLGVVALWPFSIIDFDDRYVGTIFKSALDISRGLLPFREASIPSGWLTSLIQAVFLRLFGERAVSAALSVTLFYAMTFALLNYLLAQYTKESFAFVITLIALCTAASFFAAQAFLPWSSVYALFFLLLTCTCLHWAVVSHRMRYCVLTGICTSLVFWCMHAAGLILFASLGVLALLALLTKSCTRKAWLSRCLYAFCGLAAIHMVMLLVLWQQNTLADWWAQGFRAMQSLSAHPEEAEAYIVPQFLASPPWPAKADALWLFLPLSGFFLLGITFAKALRRKQIGLPERQRMLPLFGLSITAILLWQQAHPLQDVRLAYVAGFLLLIAFGILLYALCRNLQSKKARRLALAGLVVLSFGSEVSQSIYQGYEALQLPSGETYVSYANDHYAYLDGLRLPKSRAVEYDLLFETLQRLELRFPEKNIVNLTDQRFYDFFARESWYQQPRNHRNERYPDFREEARAYLQKERPVVISFASTYDDEDILAGYDVYYSIADAYNYNAIYLPTEDMLRMGEHYSPIEAAFAFDYAIDDVAGIMWGLGAEAVYLTPNQPMRIQGWMIDRTLEQRMRTVTIRIGTEDFPCEVKYRGDLIQGFGNERFGNCGYIVTIPYDALPEGTHTWQLCGYSADDVHMIVLDGGVFTKAPAMDDTNGEL